jgi:paraquat-inducible protein B
VKHLKSIAEMSTKLVKKQLNGVLTEIFKPLEELEVESAKKNAKSITKSQKKKLLKTKSQNNVKIVREANLSYFRSTKKSSKATQELLNELLNDNAAK